MLSIDAVISRGRNLVGCIKLQISIFDLSLACIRFISEIHYRPPDRLSAGAVGYWSLYLAAPLLENARSWELMVCLGISLNCISFVQHAKISDLLLSTICIPMSISKAWFDMAQSPGANNLNITVAFFIPIIRFLHSSCNPLIG